MRRPASGVALVLVGLVLVAACGLPSDDQAQEVAPADVPFGLLDAATTTIPDVPSVEQTRPVTLYFQNDERLIAVPSQVAGGSGPVSVETAVTELLKGTSSLAVPAGVRSAIPGGTRLLGAQDDDGIVTLDLSDELAGVEANGFVFAIAQLVSTAVGIDAEHPEGTNRIVIRIDGEKVNLPNDEGVGLDRPVSPSDYATLAPVTGRVAGADEPACPQH